MTRSAVALVALALLVPNVDPAEDANPLRIPGTAVSLVAPEGFVIAEDFPGLKHPDTLSSIVVSEVPLSATMMRASLTPENAAKRGMVVSGSETVQLGDEDASLYSIVQNVQGSVYHKWMIVFGSEEKTIMVVATFLEKYAPEMSEPAKAALLSVSRDPDAPLDYFEGLSFQIEESSRLKIVRRVGNMITLGGNDEPGAPDLPDLLYLIGSSFEAATGDVKGFSERRLKASYGVVDIEIVEGRPVTIAGLEGYEIVATASDEDSADPLTLYQAILPGEDVYYIAYGQSAPADAEVYLSEFRQVTESLRLTASPAE
jgi:hypothetical protein